MEIEAASLIVSRESLQRALKLGNASVSDCRVYQAQRRYSLHLKAPDARSVHFLILCLPCTICQSSKVEQMDNNHKSELEFHDSQETLNLPSGANYGDERKLWFDYIKTLNERQLQASQRAGVTTYVLLGTLIGLLYKFGPQVPQFVSQPGSVRASLVIFGLLSIVLTSFFMAIIGMSMYLGGESEFRATPKSNEHAIPVLYGIFAIIAAIFVSLYVWIAISSADHFLRYLLLAYAVWLIANIITPTIRYRALSKKAKDIKNPIPKFSQFRFPPAANLFLCGLMIVWSGLGTVALVRCVKTLPNYGLQPIKAASVSLIAVSIVGYMVLRSLGSATQYKYFGFERDIVLNRMTPAEIRNRYLRDLSGPDMAQWLDDAMVTLDLKEEHLKREQNSAREKLKEIANINAEYVIERKERAASIADNLRKALFDCISQYEVLTFQTGFFIESYTTQEEREALKQRFTLLRQKTSSFKEKVSTALRLLDELKQEVG